ncbi:hypothetical protein AIOL_001132 [Candidatus Rhodobacter oscarellae]|uniref:Uncharacterized protein n=1 Tax=Candidatus Rhodobacter oscarellae TaxID=1675527 RepID=A0A0J9E0D4_9RHOB|nr:hypothetical protein AIOL_001132 [Candidatus Rhodobacter lobularis]
MLESRPAYVKGPRRSPNSKTKQPRTNPGRLDGCGIAGSGGGVYRFKRFFGAGIGCLSLALHLTRRGQEIGQPGLMCVTFLPVDYSGLFPPGGGRHP